jgi:hypothetical protein
MYHNPYAAEHADGPDQQPTSCDACDQVFADCTCPQPVPAPDCEACGAHGPCAADCPGTASLLPPRPADLPAGEPWGF